jgi:nitroreductase
MDVFEAIAHRHSYRDEFSDRPMPRENLIKIVRAGLQAPSGKNAQTTTFVIVDNPELVQKIGAMHSMKAMQQAKALIACIVDGNPEPVYEGYSFQIEDCSAAVENILLAITALGYATVWIDGWLRVEGRAKKIADLLGVPETKLVRVLLPIGLPAKVCMPKEKKPFEDRVWFNRYKS